MSARCAAGRAGPRRELVSSLRSAAAGRIETRRRINRTSGEPRSETARASSLTHPAQRGIPMAAPANTPAHQPRRRAHEAVQVRRIGCSASDATSSRRRNANPLRDNINRRRDGNHSSSAKQIGDQKKAKRCFFALGALGELDKNWGHGDSWQPLGIPATTITPVSLQF